MASNAWADQSLSAPSSPTSPQEPGKKAVKLVKKMVERAATMVDVRKRVWKKFGDAVNNDQEITVKEKPVYLELGTVDPLEKACTDEVLTLLHNSQNLRMDVPLAQHLAKLKREAAAAGKKDAVQAAEAAAGAGAGASPVASPTSGNAPQTWAERNRAKKDREAGGAAGGPGGQAKAAYERNKVRVSNLVDTITATELERLFGPANGLGTIQRIYQPKFKDGAPKHFCYITYRTPAEADAAVKKNNRIAFRNVVLLVDYGTDPNAPAAGGARRF